MTVSEGAGKQRVLFVLQDSYVWSPVKLHVATASSEEDTKGSDVATLLSTYVNTICYAKSASIVKSCGFETMAASNRSWEEVPGTNLTLDCQSQIDAVWLHTWLYLVLSPWYLDVEFNCEVDSSKSRWYACSIDVYAVYDLGVSWNSSEECVQRIPPLSTFPYWVPSNRYDLKHAVWWLLRCSIHDVTNCEE